MKKEYIVLLCILFIVLYITHLKKSIPSVKKPCFGMQICGVGNGHISQAKSVYDILEHKYDIPIVIIHGAKKNSADSVFPKDKIVYEDGYTTQEDVNNMNILPIIKDAVKNKHTEKYENAYGVNTWLNFWVTDIHNMRTQQINISNQILLPSILVSVIVVVIKFINQVEIVSIGHPNKFSNKHVPALISTDPIDRRNVNKDIILAYSVSGSDFPYVLYKLANNYPEKSFHFFSKKHHLNFPSNVNLHNPQREKFKQLLAVAGAVLCTSGHELVQECVYNCIPVATMPCSRKQFEQRFNYKQYCEKLQFAVKMNKRTDLVKLVNRKPSEINRRFIESIQNRPSDVLKCIESCIY